MFPECETGDMEERAVSREKGEREDALPAPRRLEE